MILKDKFDILMGDFTTIKAVPAKFVRIDGLPKRCVFVIHRRIKLENEIEDIKCEYLNHLWVVVEFTSTYVVGTGATPEDAVKDAVSRFSNSDYNGDTIAFKKLCKAAREAWLSKRIDDIPHLEPYEQLAFIRDASLVKKIPIWESGND